MDATECWAVQCSAATLLAAGLEAGKRDEEKIKSKQAKIEMSVIRSIGDLGTDDDLFIGPYLGFQ